ncbi:unnamed protein product [Allacma fusca]|uniref:Uncharacterized protein n=1 Tax=Allacma fusca TaxID=39272 RepID=A0A8J2K075_9HEXA|nr:unnamed protein product [Allacma fusca]
MEGHKDAYCKKKVTCGIDDCERNHHKLLHKTEEENRVAVID